MANQNNQFTIDDLKDVVAGALSTVLSIVGDGGSLALPDRFSPFFFVGAGKRVW